MSNIIYFDSVNISIGEKFTTPNFRRKAERARQRRTLAIGPNQFDGHWNRIYDLSIPANKNNGIVL